MSEPILLLAARRLVDAGAAELLGLVPLVPERGCEARIEANGGAFIWPGHGDMESLAGSLPGVRVLDPYRLKRFAGPQEFSCHYAKAAPGAASAVLQAAMRESVPVGLAIPKTRYQGLHGMALADLGDKLAAPIEAIPTWSPLWNSVCGMFGGRVGLAREWYTMVGGGSGLGKTYTVTNLAAAAMENEALSPEVRSPAFHSLEMSWEALGLRMLSRLSGEPIYRLEPGKMHDREAFHRAQAVMDAYRRDGVQIRMPRRPIAKLRDLVDSVRYEYEVHGTTLHIVDYVQLIWIEDAEKMQSQIIEASHALRKLFLDLRLVGVVLSQLTREATNNRTERPRKENLIGGSALENDSEQVLLLDHTRIERVPGVGWRGWLNMDKNRDGELVDVPIEFGGKTLSMRERMDDEITLAEVEPKQKGRKR